MRRFTTFLAVLLASNLIYGQLDTLEVDSIQVDILPYIEPLHSDRPGNTFDYDHLSIGQMVQFGLSYRDIEFGQQAAYSAQVRFGTCIGEFDLELSSLNTGEERIIDNPFLFSDISSLRAEHFAGLWYRVGKDINDKLGVGILAGTSIGSIVSRETLIFQGFVPDTSQRDTFAINSSRIAYGMRLNATVSYSFDNHWNLSSTVGLVSYDLESTSFPRFTATLNGSYSFGRWMVFAEIFTFDLAEGKSAYNVGGSVLITSAFSVDAYFGSSTNYLDFNEGTANVGMTYFFR